MRHRSPAAHAPWSAAVTTRSARLYQSMREEPATEPLPDPFAPHLGAPQPAPAPVDDPVMTAPPGAPFGLHLQGDRLS